MSVASWLPAVLNGSTGAPTPQPRGPLPPFPPGTYDHDLWFPPPAAPSPRYWRGNAWTMSIPGLPFVYQGSSEHPERCLTGFYGRWDPSWRATIVKTYAERGYTHFLRWLADERDGTGLSIQQYVDTSREILDGGVPYLAHSFLSKTYDPRDADASYYQPKLDPWIDALLSAKAITHALIGFELNLFNVPGAPLQSIIDYLTGRLVPEGVLCYVHFSSEVTWWGTTDRSDWWNQQAGKLTGLCYQCDPAWDIPTAQARYCDTINSPIGFVGRDSGFGHPFDFIVLETQDELAFTQDHPNEDDLDLYGYLSLCTKAALPVMGFGSGARYPSGAVL